jgi:hypothetical protein
VARGDWITRDSRVHLLVLLPIRKRPHFLSTNKWEHDTKKVLKVDYKCTEWARLGMHIGYWWESQKERDH